MRAIDLFAGGGGLSLGFSLAGFDIAAAFDSWSAAVEVYKSNFDHPVFLEDLSTGNVKEKIKNYSPDIIIGGPPCQDFSSAGKRDESCGRADLTTTFADIVAFVKPKWFVMENVSTAQKSKITQAAIANLRAIGYGVTICVLDASFYGVPQSRKRLFAIGKMDASDGFLQKAINDKKSSSKMTLRDYFGSSLGIEHYYRHPRSYARRAVFSIDEPSPTIRGVNRPIPKGYKGHHGDPVDINDNVRILTTLERSQIQTFPKNFKFFGSKTDVEQIIGNAVPVNLAKAVATVILEQDEALKQNRPNIAG